MDAEKPLAELCEVSKSFGPTRSLDRVSFAVRGGEVHVLAGGNGAGKSTLIKVLSGVFDDYTGVVRIAGRPVRLHRPEDSRRAGIATIHQELPLVRSLSVTDNLFLGASGGTFGRIARKTERARALELLASVGLAIDPDRLVETLPLAQRQLVEIARALGRDARVVVFDEPTSALSQAGAEQLFSRIEELRRAGRGIIYISHRMEEIYRLADRITVLRDGAVVATGRPAELPEPELVRAMVGRALEGAPRESLREQGEVLLAVERFSGRRAGRAAFEEMSFEVRAGEVLGVTGLSGSGASELLHALGGDFSGELSGQVRLGDRPFSASGPGEAIERGVVLLPNDRALSVFAELGLVENGTLSSLRRFSVGGFVRRAAERAATTPLFDRLALTAALARRRARELSGGNRQRLALARCLLAEPRVLLLDEPTRGVDVAAKQDLYRLLHELAREGLAIVWIASELEELMDQSDRILVLSRGRIAGTFSGKKTRREELIAAAMRGPSAA